MAIGRGDQQQGRCAGLVTRWKQAVAGHDLARIASLLHCRPPGRVGGEVEAERVGGVRFNETDRVVLGPWVGRNAAISGVQLDELKAPEAAVAYRRLKCRPVAAGHPGRPLKRSEAGAAVEQGAGERSKRLAIEFRGRVVVGDDRPHRVGVRP